MMAAGKQINQTAFYGRTQSAWNCDRRRNRTIPGFLRPSVSVRVRIQDNVLLGIEVFV